MEDEYDISLKNHFGNFFIINFLYHSVDIISVFIIIEVYKIIIIYFFLYLHHY